MIKAVFDTNVFFQAAINSTGPAYQCWKAVLAGKVRVYMTPGIFGEIRDIAGRPKIRTRFPQLQGQTAFDLIHSFRNKSIFVYMVEELNFVPRDPNDKMFLDLAFTVDADYMVSRDNDLLDLRDD